MTGRRGISPSSQSATPRGECTICGYWVTLNVDGSLHAHGYRQGRVITSRGSDACPGSYEPPETSRQRQIAYLQGQVESFRRAADTWRSQAGRQRMRAEAAEAILRAHGIDPPPRRLWNGTHLPPEGGERPPIPVKGRE